jgi:hypothetical protein
MFRKLLFLSTFWILCQNAFAQDTITLINGRVIPVLNVDFQEYRIAYRKIPKESTKIADTLNGQVTKAKKKSKLRTMDPYRVFSVKFRDGSERIIYQPDSLDPMEFSQEQMRLFIKGEQDAAKYYKNNLNKGIGFGLGVASGFLGFYGLAGPPIYSTIMGSFTPNLNNRLKRQNELENTRITLDKTVKPVMPAAAESDAQILKDYDLSLKKYESAEKDYESALKNHQKNISFSDVKLMESSEYREGYERKARDRKIRNTMLSGLAGFVLLVVGLPIIY